MSTARVDFTRSAADRIANVVRLVERGNRDQAPLSFARTPEMQPSEVRMCTWEGAWGKDQTHVIEFQAGVTAVAYNRYFGFKPATFPVAYNGTGVVLKGKDAFTGSWVLACFSLDAVDGYLDGYGGGDGIQILGHTGGSEEGEDGQIGPFLKWYSITTCEASQ